MTPTQTQAVELLRTALSALVTSLAEHDDEGMIEHAQQMTDARAALAATYTPPTPAKPVCLACNGTRCIYGVIGDPPSECDLCSDQEPDTAPAEPMPSTAPANLGGHLERVKTPETRMDTSVEGGLLGMPSTASEDARAAFEAWYAPIFAGGHVANMPRRSNGEYVKVQAEIAWMAYRAALAKPSTIASAENSQDQQECIPPSRAEPAELAFLEEWLRFAEEPVGMVCCGQPTTGAQYMGQTEMVCCGNGEPAERDAVEVIAAMQARHKVLTAEVSASRCRAQGGVTKDEGCTRSHPHEEMDEECQRKTIKARIAAATPGDAAKGE